MMKIKKSQLRRIIREAVGNHLLEMSDPIAQKLENALNSWLYDKVAIEHVRGQTYVITGVSVSSVPEVKEEIDEFPGASFEYELGHGNTRDIGVRIG